MPLGLQIDSRGGRGLYSDAHRTQAGKHLSPKAWETELHYKRVSLHINGAVVSCPQSILLLGKHFWTHEAPTFSVRTTNATTLHGSA